MGNGTKSSSAGSVPNGFNFSSGNIGGGSGVVVGEGKAAAVLLS